MDIQTAGTLIKILRLMAQVDGYVAAEELFVLERVSSIFIEKARIPSWADAFGTSEDISTLAADIPCEHRMTTATIAYMLVSSSRDEYQFAVNIQEQTAFDLLCDGLMLTEEEIIKARTDAINELIRKPGLWENITSRVPNLF